MPLNGTAEHAEPKIDCTRIGYELAEYWPWIREGLLRIKKKDPECGAWTPEQIRAMLLNATNQHMPFPCLHVVHFNNEPAAFTVLTAPPDPYVLVPVTMYVFGMYVDPRRVRGEQKRRVKNLLLAHAMKIGQDNGLLELEAHTIREGWSKFAPEYNFRLARVVYRKSLVGEA